MCRLSCGCGGRAGAFELIGPCALIWCLAFLRCDLCDSRQHPTSKNLSTKRQQHRRRVFAKRNNSFHGDVHGARFNDASALPYTLQRRSVAASLKSSGLVALGGACNGDFRMFRGVFRASLGSVWCSRCHGFAPPQLWTNSRIVDFGLSVPFLEALARMCHGNCKMFRGVFCASLRPV